MYDGNPSISVGQTWYHGSSRYNRSNCVKSVLLYNPSDHYVQIRAGSLIAYAHSIDSSLNLENFDNLDNYFNRDDIDLDIKVNNLYLHFAKIDEDNPFHTFPLIDDKDNDPEFDDEFPFSLYQVIDTDIYQRFDYKDHRHQTYDDIDNRHLIADDRLLIIEDIPENLRAMFKDAKINLSPEQVDKVMV